MRMGVLASFALMFCLEGVSFAQGRPAAQADHVQGAVQLVGRSSHALGGRERMAPEVSLSLPNNAVVEMHFYADGHREVVTGPCLVRVGTAGCRVIQGGEGSLVRVGSGQRVLAIGHNGNLQSVGGSQAGISDVAVSKKGARGGLSRPLPESDQDESPVAHAHALDTKSSHPAPSQPTIQPGPTPDTLQPILVGLQITTADAREFRLSGDLTGITASLSGIGPLAFQGDRLLAPDLKPGHKYILTLRKDGILQQEFPFRMPDGPRATRLQELLAEPPSALVVDSLDRLGFPGLAAQQAELLLVKLNNEDRGLLTYLYHLYRGPLADRDRADAVKLKARAAGLEL